MKKILLIDDRATRQSIACSNTSLNLSDYKDILENATGDIYDTINEQFSNEEFNVDKYASVLTHKNAYGEKNQEILYWLKNLCKDHNIPLVLFSGGISISHYEKSDDHEKLELNSKVFYGTNLKLFLEHYKNQKNIELMILGYGKNWETNTLLNILEKINILIYNMDTDMLYEEFSSKVELDLLDKDIKLETENGWVNKEEIKKLAAKIEQLLKQRILYGK